MRRQAVGGCGRGRARLRRWTWLGWTRPTGSRASRSCTTSRTSPWPCPRRTRWRSTRCTRRRRAGTGGARRRWRRSWAAGRRCGSRRMTTTGARAAKNARFGHASSSATRCRPAATCTLPMAKERWRRKECRAYGGHLLPMVFTRATLMARPGWRRSSRCTGSRGSSAWPTEPADRVPSIHHKVLCTC